MNIDKFVNEIHNPDEEILKVMIEIDEDLKKEQSLKLKRGDKILWDSGFGYDVGTFEEYYPEDSILYDHCKIEIKLPSAVPIYKVFPYTEEKYNELKEKYGY